MSGGLFVAGMVYELINITKDTVLAGELLVADCFWHRMIGLLLTKELEENRGLLLKPCNSIHTMFMRYPIDIVFLGRDFTVMKTVSNLKPWRTVACRGAFMAAEFRPGTIAKTKTSVNDTMSLRPCKA
jgi:uncharacterized membrane protein (UPF0127 family)